MKHDAIIVGGGIAGLTAAAFLCKQGCSVLLCEKEDRLGGLVGSYTQNGFTFDAGLRAMENSGVLLPMLKSLGIEMEFLENEVSIGVEKNIVRLAGAQSLAAYGDMLKKTFPEDAADIDRLLLAVQQTMGYMDVLYGIDNPVFMNLKDTAYLAHTLLPWAMKYMLTVGKIKKLSLPIEDYLRGIIQNPSLIDCIAQHFFKGTPAFFALSYLSLYLDYRYPRGGTGALVEKLEAYILAHGGEVQTGTKIVSVNPTVQTLTDGNGAKYPYETMIWAADMNALYISIDKLESMEEPGRTASMAQKKCLEGLHGGDSVLTLYLAADLPIDYFKAIHSPHFFYTPEQAGLHSLPDTGIRLHGGTLTDDREALKQWLRAFLRLTTYEISIPAMRDPALAPKGKAGLVISTLTDYELWKHIRDMGWYDECKALCQKTIEETLCGSVYPELADKIISGSVSTPLTLEQRTGNTGGAITGWAFTNPRIPAVSRMTQIAKSVVTPIPNVWQAGQWTYSPSGFPISILTGKMAADAVLKRLR
ncbi:MAG TPA: NAD(P)/FAD-dependent oxidoreductase [Candidatus Limiplasma sp.]|nr:NAD(P)/FAD-dependent oxidoreductase [Candidatus Limiplasma sp.]HRX07877.1 NAD(P)/FAD-dependent oxidoreductase [Candidatus Limiplasma sp.]